MDTGTGILSTNMYAYCYNNPIKLCDPTGFFAGKGAVHTRTDWAIEYLRANGIPEDLIEGYANTLMAGNAYVDKWYGLSPTWQFYDSYSQSWHFNTTFPSGTTAGTDKDSRMKRYRESEKAAIKSLQKAGNLQGDKKEEEIKNALFSFGMGLHARQDMIAHTGKGGDFSVLGLFRMHIKGLDDNVTDAQIDEAHEVLKEVLDVFIHYYKLL